MLYGKIRMCNTTVATLPFGIARQGRKLWYHIIMLLKMNPASMWNIINDCSIIQCIEIMFGLKFSYCHFISGIQNSVCIERYLGVYTIIWEFYNSWTNRFVEQKIQNPLITINFFFIQFRNRTLTELQKGWKAESNSQSCIIFVYISHYPF